MNLKVAGSIAAAAVLGLGIAACGSSPSSSGSGAPQGKPLTIVTTELSPMTDTFNPYVQTSTGYTMHAADLYNQPLFVFNTQNPTQSPAPELGTAYSWRSEER